MKKYIIYMAVLLFSCSEKSNTNITENKKKSGGYKEDRVELVENIPVIASKDFNEKKYSNLRGKPVKNQDDDGDGILNKSDKCPNEPETYNGYLDGDGCPDTIVIVPPPPPPPTPSTEVLITMPPVGNQGGEGSCVAFSVGYYTRSSEYFYKTGATSYSNSTNVFSPEYLYNQTTFSQTDCSIGTSMQMVLDIIVNQGVCTYSTMPYSSTNGCSLQPNATQTSEATNYKINGYSKIAFTDRTAIKSMVSQKHPVIIAILADNSFINAGTGFIWKTFSGSGMLAHSVTICGYDDTKNAYKIINSWGTGWADGGYSWIDYNFFETGGRIAGAGWVYVINN